MKITVSADIKLEDISDPNRESEGYLLYINGKCVKSCILYKNKVASPFEDNFCRLVGIGRYNYRDYKRFIKKHLVEE